MAVFLPFRAYRPTTREALRDVTSKPYDVLSAQEARKEAENNEISFYRVIKPEIDFQEGQNPFAPEVYHRGLENLNNLIHKGILAQEDREKFYVYRIQMGQHVQTGLVGCCSIDDYFNSTIKKHELTNPAIEASRMKHITTSQFTYEPVFFAYRKNPSLDEIVKRITREEPLYGFTSTDYNLHTLWSIDDDKTIRQITQIFEREIDSIYIADGHHRTAAGALAGDNLRQSTNGKSGQRYSDLMCVLFPHNQVQIMDYNRVVKDLGGHSPESFMALISENFDIDSVESPYRPESQQNIGMYLQEQWYKLTAHDGTYNLNDLIDNLGFTILSKYILTPILSIENLRTDKRIDFVGGIRGLEELEKRVDSGEMKVAFSMHPISMNEIMQIADKNLLLPPKVTWFEPKLRSGIFVHSLNGQI